VQAGSVDVAVQVVPVVVPGVQAGVEVVRRECEIRIDRLERAIAGQAVTVTLAAAVPATTVDQADIVVVGP